jgi:hypothetical protein
VLGTEQLRACAEQRMLISRWPETSALRYGAGRVMSEIE